MTKVAIIGSGFVGRAWAISFARAGCEIALWDQDKEAPGKALAYIERLLPDLEASDLLNGGKAAEVAARIRPTTTLESALEGAAHVQENTPENVEVKRAVFARLDAAAPPDKARALYDYLVTRIREQGLLTETGVFQASMQVELVNDGPVTLLLES